ncbi:MAG: type II secretion system major pseudopilin GspG [Leptospira sp.]|nr:type II secretion system major pseudopilin GspG [Leptospira sp.]
MKIKSFSRVRKSLREGLTLVELAVVVLIMGTLIAIVAFNIDVGALKDDTAGLQLRKDASTISGALLQYENKYGRLPTEEQGLSALVEKPTSGDAPEDFTPLLKNKSAILDPWKTPYHLKKDPNSGDFMIVSYGKDKKEGGEGKDADFDIRNEDSYPSAFRKK